MSIAAPRPAPRVEPTLGPATGRAPGGALAALIGFVACAYLLFATWAPPYNVDAYTNVLQAHSFAAEGSVSIDGADHLTDPAYFRRVALLVEAADGRPTSQYPPGVALWAAPFYLLDTSKATVESTFTAESGGQERVTLPVPSFAPGTLAAVVASVAAMAFLALTLRRVLPERAVHGGVVAFALGTGVWSVASDQLWQHGPAMMALSAAMYLAASDRFALSGLAFAAAALVRPHTVVIAAAVGIAVSWRRRDPAPAVRMGVTSALGLAAVVVYNRVVFGTFGVSGGYGSGFADNVLSPDLLVWAGRIGSGLISPDHGLLVTSPFLVLTFVALKGRFGAAPGWAVGGALGGALYLLLQYKANRSSGGHLFFGYRYPLEALVVAAPMLWIAVVSWARGRRRMIALAALVAVSVAINAYGAAFVGS